MVSLDQVVRAEVNGTQFDVPLRYFYGESIDKRGHWPEPLDDRVKVDVLHLSVLLPDLRGYYPEDEARWKERGPGGRIQVNVMKPVGASGWFAAGRERGRKDVAEGRARAMPPIFGLEVFDQGWLRTHFPQDGRETMISCQPAEPGVFPSCSVKSAYRPGLVLEYGFGGQHLERWREIDDGLKALFDRFVPGTAVH